MKNSKLLLLLLALSLVVCMLVACTPRPCDECVDEDKNGRCDVCDNEYTANDDNTDGGNDDNGGNEPLTPCTDTHIDAQIDGTCDVCGNTYQAITVAEALELCGETSGNITTERYYVRATVKTISNTQYGSMIIEDSTGSISVYGTYSYNGDLTFDKIGSTPVRGDEVILHCILQNYNGTKEVKNARLVGFTHTEADLSDYQEMTIAGAREAAEGALIVVEGVVARITYANGHVPAGVILVDDTQAIYVYGSDVAGAVEIGNKVKVAGVKDYWILDTETFNAAKYGYEGCNQLSDATLIENDKGNNSYNKSWITETTVKEIMDTPVTEDITTTIFKVNALVKKVPGSGFVNYYIDDLDGETGSYVYTQCNGSDFSWLDAFDGKICTVYLTALNAKSSTSGCVWRFIPVEVIDENYTFDLNDTAEFVVNYHALDQFLASYAWNPVVTPTFELVNGVNSELLGFTGATISYASSDEAIIKFETTDGTTTMKLVGFGTVTVTITGEYQGQTYSTTLTIVSSESSNIDSITVSEAIAASKGTTVIVKGIVGPSLVNKDGFYLIDESGVIAVTGPVTIFEGLKIGNEVIIKGVRNVNVKDTTTSAIGQTYISDVEILANDYGNHDYSTATFVSGKTIEEVYALDPLVDYSTTVFVLQAKVLVEEAQYYSNIYLTSLDGSVKLRLYASSASQYNWLKAYNGQTVTVEVAACNWNDKNYYTGCALAVVLEDGSKVYNTLNFSN